MALKDIIGQDRPIHILQGCIAKERIPHALFFTGDEGIGKKLTAVHYAKALNCVKADSEDLFSFGAEQEEAQDMDQIDSCDRCPSCTKIDSGNHPDVCIIGPEGEGGQITVSAIRQLQEALSYKPYEGEWKIAIIDNADRLNQSAANAFLRTLEEPSAHSIIILISSRPDMLLPTIRSRCQRINFSPLPVDTMSSLLREKNELIDDDRARLLSILSGGRLGYAVDESLIDHRDRSFNLFEQMLGSMDDEIWEDKEAMENWFDWSQLLLRDIAVFSATGSEELLINQDMADEVKSMSRRAELRDILKLARELYNIRRKLIFNLNKQLTFNYVRLLLRTHLGQGRFNN